MDVQVVDDPPPLRGALLYRAEIAGTAAEKNRVIAESVREIAARETLGPTEVFRLRLCLDEAIQNAIEHGNGSDPRKKVFVAVFDSGDRWEIVVRDDGGGFRPQRVPDPREGSGLEAEGGRGLLILTEYMDSVSYFDAGRTLVLTKRKPALAYPLA